MATTTTTNAVYVDSPNVTYTPDWIESRYEYHTTTVRRTEGSSSNNNNNNNNNGRRPPSSFVAVPEKTNYVFRTHRRVPKLGVMIVGWGGNNGSTVTAAVLANGKGLCWSTKEGTRMANYYGSLTQAGTVLLGRGEDGEVYVPIKDLLPLVDANDIVFDGWDISSMNLGDAMRRAQVLDYDVQRQLYTELTKLQPRPSIYAPDFIALNQRDRADHTLSGTTEEMVTRVREDIRDFKAKSGVDKVIVIWSANTERFSDVRPGLNDSALSLMSSIKRGDPEISPSTLFAVASILEGVTYINGSPQNTFVPGVIELAQQHNVYIGGDDFKSGQTKVKSVLVDFLVSAGIKPVSIVSYNHLGNNDGKNLNTPETFRSKEISKTNVVDDVVNSNNILYEPGEKPDHCVVIKYVPHVGDSKRAMDEYTSEIMMGGTNTIVLHNTCEDSLLAAPIILDLAILAELCERIELRKENESEFHGFNSALSILSYLCKAPLAPSGTPVVNAFFKQRACIDNIFRACIGLPPIHNMGLEYKQRDAHQAIRHNSSSASCVSGVKADHNNKTNSSKQPDKEAKATPGKDTPVAAAAAAAAAGAAVTAMGNCNGHVMNGSNGHVMNGSNGPAMNGSNGHVMNGSNGHVI